MTEQPSPQEERGPRRVYRSGAIEVHWEPRFCIHSGNCVRGLGRVFDPPARPWVDVNAADPEAADEAPSMGLGRGGTRPAPLRLFG
jgi:uncharacterized Fe-S cluster protein YjdI